MNEPPIQPNDLEERIKTTKNRVDIALLLIEHDRLDLINTILEDMFFGIQTIMDYYCVKER